MSTFGALIAAHLVSPGNLVIATATTSAAIAQHTDALLGLDNYRDRLTIISFVADSARHDDAPTTLSTLIGRSYTSCTLHGRRLVEQILLHPESTLHLTDEEYEEYRIAENHNSEATEQAVAILLRVHVPSVMFLTASSLLNSAKLGGLFHGTLASCTVIIDDKTFQLPNSAFVALTTRSPPRTTYLYRGTHSSLEPQVRCSRTHPALNELLNVLVYDEALTSGTPAHHRSLMVDRLTLPNPAIPFMMVNIEGIPSESFGVMTFYKCQQRLIERTIWILGIHLHTRLGPGQRNECHPHFNHSPRHRTIYR
ncbi:hypothetical protein COOONC_28242 [Cooperia oncophora]